MPVSPTAERRRSLGTFLGPPLHVSRDPADPARASAAGEGAATDQLRMPEYERHSGFREVRDRNSHTRGAESTPASAPPATTREVAPSDVSRVRPFGSSLPASWCWLPQTNAECRVPTVRQPSPKRRVVQLALLRRTSATQMTGGATLQLCL